MRSLANHWSPLTHASHCMTTSRPAATTQMRVGVSPAMHPEGSPLTHTSRCMTTSRPTATTQMRVGLSPAMHPEVCLRWMPSLAQTSLFLGLKTGSEYASLHTPRLGFDEVSASVLELFGEYRDLFGRIMFA